MGIHDDRVYLKHILEAVGRIESYVSGLDYDQFKVDEKTTRSTLYDLAVIGEAARRVSPKFREEHPDIPWRKIMDMRNVLVHDYTGVEYPTVWKTVQKDLPQLKKMVSAVL